MKKCKKQAQISRRIKTLEVHFYINQNLYSLGYTAYANYLHNPIFLNSVKNQMVTNLYKIINNSTKINYNFNKFNNLDPIFYLLQTTKKGINLHNRYNLIEQ